MKEILEVIGLDMRKRPDLFVWEGPATLGDIDIIEEWWGYDIPKDLTELWLVYGGGVIFESETILSCSKDHDEADQIIVINEFHKSMDFGYEKMIFHIGMGGLSAINIHGNVFVIDDNYDVNLIFENLNSWYINYIRKEYRNIYNL